MQQKLYTREGKEYVIKTVNNALQVTYAVPTNISKYVFINLPAAFPESISLNTSNPIIPISYSASAFTGSVVSADISNSYFVAQNGKSFEILPAYRQTLGKIYPYIQRIYYTDDNNNNFIIRYNELILSDQDFLATNDALLLGFSSSLGKAMASYFTFVEAFTLPAGTYSLCFSMTYLELQ